MKETMPKINHSEEEEKPDFKVEDKRNIDIEKIDREIKEEKEKKKFDSMTSEQREEWEYNRDKERGFSVKDKRPIFDRIEPRVDMPQATAPEEQKEIEEVRENIEQIQPTVEPIPPEFYAWKMRLEEYDNELKTIEQDYKDTKLGARTILGYGAVHNEIKAFRQKFEKFAELELARTTVPVKREVLIDEFAKMTQRLDDMEDQILLAGGGRVKKTFRAIGKPFKKIGGLFRRK